MRITSALGLLVGALCWTSTVAGKVSTSPIGCPVDRLIFSNEDAEKLVAKRVSQEFNYITAEDDTWRPYDTNNPPPLEDENGNHIWSKVVGSMVLEAEFGGKTVYVVYEQMWAVPCCGLSSYSRLSDAFDREITWSREKDIPVLPAGEQTMYHFSDIDSQSEYSRPGIHHPLAGKTFRPIQCQGNLERRPR